MPTVSPGLRPRRRVILRDSVTLLVLLFSALALYAVTTFLFQSFSARRAQLGRQFAVQGQRAMNRGDAAEAVHDLRLSLSYAPDETGNRLLLAEALAQAHHVEEARSYFLSLLETQPADGFLNLQLARLARQKKETQSAIDFYRAATAGNWNGDPGDERFRVQLELADYLIQLGDLPSARAELLIAAADAPDDPSVALMLGERFEQAGDASDALNLYRKAIKLNPKGSAALYKAGRLAYGLGEFPEAARLLYQARRASLAAPADEADLESLLENSRRIQELTLSADLDPQDRTEHILRALPIARARFASCTAQSQGAPLTGAAAQLENQWKDAQRVSQRRALEQNGAQQEALMNLIFDTEQLTAKMCGTPAGDDALLLQLANSARGVHSAGSR